MSKATSKGWCKLKDAGKHKKKWEARRVKRPECDPICLLLPHLFLGIGRRKKE